MIKLIINEYKRKCGDFLLRWKPESKNHKLCIETKRFIAYTLYSEENVFQMFPLSIQNLYTITFADPIVMSKYKYGLPKTVKEFETMVKEKSLCALHGDPFVAFIITDKESGNVIGYEEIDKSDTDGIGEISYIFSKQYHNGAGQAYKYVGYENVGALTWGYGAHLYRNGTFVNPSKQQFKTTVPFKGLMATVRTDNFASSKILENLGFKQMAIIKKFGHERYLFELDFNNFE
ncbi:GNAT family N-acetyltransferase [Candidatus Cardinium hertigii]|uniref:N-acetyltransferase domain-containing protein n=1 Tax=Candidatus Cardinium hertigii TaxID=247481 RepID=A0A2Z3L922_9BACT|nr:GNAT family N-acetyltransferase [Candidatus Cardinium hertigii]AWN82048.1 hypothetical protein DK880_00738 [Candidatus Cardinium hertigii]